MSTMHPKYDKNQDTEVHVNTHYPRFNFFRLKWGSTVTKLILWMADYTEHSVYHFGDCMQWASSLLTKFNFPVTG